MNTEKIFKGSWGLMLHYKALWIFGVILALTTISFGSALWLRESDNHSDHTLVNWEISPKDKAWIKENFGFDLPLTYTLTVEDLRVRLDDSSISMVEGARLFNIVITMMAVLLTLLAVTLVLRWSLVRFGKQRLNFQRPVHRGPGLSQPLVGPVMTEMIHTRVRLG